MILGLSKIFRLLTLTLGPSFLITTLLELLELLASLVLLVVTVLVLLLWVVRLEDELDLESEPTRTNVPVLVLIYSSLGLIRVDKFGELVEVVMLVLGLVVVVVIGLVPGVAFATFGLVYTWLTEP